MSIVFLARFCTAQDHPDAPPPKSIVNYLDLLQQRRTPLNPANEENAIAAAVRITGLKKEQFKSVGEIKLIDEEDKTPFLHPVIVGRPIWWAISERFSLDLSSTPEGWHDKYPRVLDVFLDPESGHLLKLATRWPEGEKEIAPEPDAANAEWQMSANEKYAGIPDADPPISLIEAIDVMQRGGGNPLVARQITGVWVQWSNLGKEPKAMWVITLRGVPPRQRYGVNPELLNHFRYVIDPVAKKKVMGSTTPQPTQLKRERPQDDGK